VIHTHMMHTHMYAIHTHKYVHACYPMDKSIHIYAYVCIPSDEGQRIRRHDYSDLIHAHVIHTHMYMMHTHMYVHACYPMEKSLNIYTHMCTCQVMEDREYDGMTIPKGDKVFVSPSLAGRRADVFTNPDEYDPLRYVVNMCLHVISYIQ